jgi:Fe-S-cluster containining protein
MEVEDSRHKNSDTMACNRCGVCCTMHQAFVTGEDIERITGFLGITGEDWVRDYDDTRWQYSEYRLIRHINGACAFLRYDGDFTTCSIEPVKPKCCRDWEPGPDKKECRQGLEKAGKKL